MKVIDNLNFEKARKSEKHFFLRIQKSSPCWLPEKCAVVAMQHSVASFRETAGDGSWVHRRLILLWSSSLTVSLVLYNIHTLSINQHI